MRYISCNWILGSNCHSRERGNPDFLRYFTWIPAFAGMTLVIFLLFIPSILFADTSANQLANLLGNITRLQANFIQTVYDGKGKALQETRGQMSLEKPGKFRWETHAPTKQLLIADGKQIWFYDVGLSQVVVQKQQGFNKNSPAMLLSGSANLLTQDFIITRLPSGEHDNLVFKLAPKTKSDLFHSVQLDFYDNKLHMMHMLDNLGQVTVINFSVVKNNPPLNASLFHFTPPTGVDVVRQ